MTFPPMPSPGWYWNAKLVRLIDADTLVMSLDLGFNEFGIRTIRLVGLNAHEHGTPDGDAATAWVQAWFARHGEAYVVETRKTPDKFSGRWDGIVWAGDTGACLNAEMIASGNAREWDGRGARP